MNISTVEQFLYSLWLVYSLVIGLYILRRGSSSPPNKWVGGAQDVLYDTVEPVLRPLRHLPAGDGRPRPGPMVAIFGLRILLEIVFAILDGFR